LRPPIQPRAGPAPGGTAFYAYSSNHLIDLKYAAILEAEASTAIRQAEVTACKTIIVRAKERFDLRPDRLGSRKGQLYVAVLALVFHG
jgi:hypothetical protein